MMDTEDKVELNPRAVLTQDHHELIQQYRKALHLHGDPAESENETDVAMRESIALSESSPISRKPR